MTALDIKTTIQYVEKLGLTSEQLVVFKGNPKKETQEEGDVFYWYESIVPSRAELYRLKDDKVVWVSIDFSDQNVLLSEFVSQFGEPQFSVMRYDQDDSLRSRVVAWPSLGRAAIVSGNDLQSKVTRVEFFESTNLESYINTWGKGYSSKEEVNLIVTPRLEQVRVLNQPTNLALSTTWSYKEIGFLLVLLVIAVGLATWLGFVVFRKKHLTH